MATIEEKAKRYDETLKRARKELQACGSSDCDAARQIFRFFPELAESEDEKIRKLLVEAVIQVLQDQYCSNRGVSKEKVVAWLEKQDVQNLDTDFSDLRTWKYIVDAVWTEKDGIGQYLDSSFTEEVAKKLQKRFGNIEQKPAFEMKTPEESLGIDSDTYNKIVDECIYGNQKPADNDKSKFKVGDWVIDKQGIVHQIANVIEIVTCHTYGYDIVGGGYFNDNTEGVRLWTIQDAKDGDVLACGNDIVIFKENSYNPKDKSGCMFVHCSCNNFYEIGGINPTDYKPAIKEQRELLFQKMKEAGYEWDAEELELKKIEQSLAWSEKDEMMWSSVLQDLQNIKDNNPIVNIAPEFNWLKSLKERCTWKPSGFHLECIEDAISLYEKHGINAIGLKEILEELKKIREE